MEAVSLCFLLACNPVVETGLASVYHSHDSGGKIASTGELLDDISFTAAHRTLPFGTRVLVTNLRNKRQVVVRINDRGPFKRGRILDLRPDGAKALRLNGLEKVKLEYEK